MTMSPRLLRPRDTAFTPRSISGLALWLDASSSDLYTTDAGPVTAVASPLDIAGCVGWWDSSDLSAMRQNSDGTGVVAAGDPVGWWLDKSATGATVTGSGSARPNLSATGFNGRQALVFNGSSTNLSNALYTATNNLSGMTRIAVCSNTNQVAFLSRVYDGGSDSFMLMNSNWRSYAVSGANLSTTLIPGAVGSSAPAGVYADVFASSAMSMYALGASLPVTVIGTIAATTGGGTPAIHIGSNIGANGFWNGPIAEYIIYNRALTRAELASVEAYLAQRWGISGVHTPATASSDPVGYWGDKSGNGRHAVQATAGNRPTISATAQNGRKALAFDGSNGWMRTERTTYAARSVITVFRRTGSANGLYLSPFAKQSNVAAGYGGAAYQVTYGNEGGWSTSDAGVGKMYYTSNGSPHKLSAAFMRGAAVPLADAQNYLTGISAAPNTTDAELLYAEAATDTDGNQAWFIGTEPFATTRKYPANILELLIYNRALTAAERQRLERYLAARWGITLAPQVSNADAQDWINRVYSNGGTVSAATAGAVNQFCTDIENAPGGSIRDRFYRLNLFAGNSDAALAAVRTPLFRGPSLGGTQYGNTTDTNNNFLAADYAENSGLLGNGSTKWLNTGFIAASSGLTSNQNIHISASIAGFTLGANAGGSLVSMARATPDPDNDRYRITVTSNSTPTTDVTATLSQSAQSTSKQIAATNGAVIPGGLWLASRGSATDLRLYNGATQEASSSSSIGSFSPLTTEMSVLAVWNGATASNLLEARIRSYSVGLNLDATQVGYYNTALAAFNAALGRS